MSYLIPLLLGLISRLCGSKWKYVGLVLYPVPYILYIPSIPLALLTFAWVFIWKLTGHADAFQDYERDNFLSEYVKLFGFERTSKLYDAAFWCTKGALIALLPAVLTGNYYLLLASAIGYPLAYRIGFSYTSRPTVYGEFLAGLFAGLGFLLY